MRAVLLLAVLAACGGPYREPDHPAPPRPDADFLHGETDSINTRDRPALRTNAKRVLRELLAALPPDRRGRIEHVQLLDDDDVGHVNAYATCAGFAQPVVAITDELLEIMAQLAAARATEELFDVEATDQYIDWMVRHQREGAPLATPPPYRRTDLRRIDRRKLARQHELFDEQVAWVLGHELAHHYLGHLACARDGGILQDARQIAFALAPIFHQIDELAADTAAVDNTLHAGRARPGYRWTHQGALLLLEFFARQHELGVAEVIFAFAQTHPHPRFRVPVIKGAVVSWHVIDGAVPLVPVLP